MVFVLALMNLRFLLPEVWLVDEKPVTPNIFLFCVVDVIRT
jgi:hypothetical protein